MAVGKQPHGSKIGSLELPCSGQTLTEHSQQGWPELSLA